MDAAINGHGELLDDLAIRHELIEAASKLSDKSLAKRHNVTVDQVKRLASKVMAGHGAVAINGNPSTPLDIYRTLIWRLNRSLEWALVRSSLGGFVLVKPGVVDPHSPRYLGIVNQNTTITDIQAMVAD